MRKLKLAKSEKAIENALIRGEFKPVSNAELSEIANAIERRKKDAVLSIRINRHDLKSIQDKAKKLHVPYQSLVAELLHRFAA
jgi:predicted DNA binding CopG/RHH family protein